MKSHMNYYNQLSNGYKKLHAEEQLKKLAEIKKFLKIKKSHLLLDVGCGTGLSKILGCKVIGIDPSIELLKQAEIPKVFGVAEFLPFKDKSFDVVISVTAIHNFADKEKSLLEMKRVGRNSFVVTVLKKSRYVREIRSLLKKIFTIQRCVEEEKDFIYLLVSSV